MRWRDQQQVVRERYVAVYVETKHRGTTPVTVCRRKRKLPSWLT